MYITFGAVAGVLAVRRASQAAQRYTPASVQDRVQGSLGSLGTQLSAFLADLKEAMAEREQELRTELGLDGTHDLVDAEPVGR
jgi:hypothetical protein